MLIAGVDEVGRGPLAGPVVAAAVVFEEGYYNPEIKDSKQLSKKKREDLIEVIKRDAVHWAIVAVGHRRINALNIREASRLAMSLAVRRVRTDKVLVDGNVRIETNIPQETIVGGDGLCVEIGAASILAKVWRDEIMAVIDRKYPGYGFNSHVGYATRTHREAVFKLGPCPIHRERFSGIKEFFCKSEQIEIPFEIG